MYFTGFDPVFPIVHAPTFRPSAKSSLLLLSICSIGSLFVGSSHAASQGMKIFETLNKAILSSVSLNCLLLIQISWTANSMFSIVGEVHIKRRIRSCCHDSSGTNWTDLWPSVRSMFGFTQMDFLLTLQIETKGFVNNPEFPRNCGCGKLTNPSQSTSARTHQRIQWARRCNMFKVGRASDCINNDEIMNNPQKAWKSWIQAEEQNR